MQVTELLRLRKRERRDRGIITFLIHYVYLRAPFSISGAACFLVSGYWFLHIFMFLISSLEFDWQLNIFESSLVLTDLMFDADNRSVMSLFAVRKIELFNLLG